MEKIPAAASAAKPQSDPLGPMIVRAAAGTAAGMAAGTSWSDAGGRTQCRLAAGLILASPSRASPRCM